MLPAFFPPRCAAMSKTQAGNPVVHAIVVAAGQGERSKLALPKQFANVLGKPMVRHSVESFHSHQNIAKLWVVIGSGQEQMLAEALSGIEGYEIIKGGEQRQESVLNGLEAIQSDGSCDIVLIHDAARPFLKHQMIDKLLSAVKEGPGAIPVLPIFDTIIEKDGDNYGTTLDRDQLGRVQTPQAFDFELLLKAHQANRGKDTATDDAQLFYGAGHKTKMVEGDEKLKKYTTETDFESDINAPEFRSGLGFDVHRLEAGEKLWLGGIKLDHEKGLSGHSDADVLLHALTDALLGTIGAGDIGDHFPPSEDKWKGAPSSHFVEHAVTLIKERGGKISNVDMTIICEAPKIKPHRESICQNIAKLLDVSVDRVGVKATTTEALGFAGRGEGIAAQAIATITLERS